MDIREYVRDIIINALVEARTAGRPSNKAPDTREPVENVGKPPKAGPRAGTKWYGKRVERKIAIKKKRGEALDDED